MEGREEKEREGGGRPRRREDEEGRRGMDIRTDKGVLVCWVCVCEGGGLGGCAHLASPSIHPPTHPSIHPS